MKAFYYPAYRTDQPVEMELLGKNSDGTVEIGIGGVLKVGRCKVVSPLEIHRAGHCSLEEDKLVEPKKK